MPPRYLVRRVLAFAIDHTLALILVTLAVLPFAGHGWRLPEPLLAYKTQTCQPLQTPFDWLPGDTSGAQFAALRLCQNHLFGLPNGRDLIAVYSATQPEDGVRLTRSLRIALTADDRPSRVPDLAGPLVLVVLGLATGLLTLGGRQSPGKALLGLRLVGPPRRGFLREALRLGPWVLISATPVLAAAPLLLAPLAVIAALVAATLLALGWFYLWPLVRWTGQMRYDRATGFQVRLKA